MQRHRAAKLGAAEDGVGRGIEALWHRASSHRIVVVDL
jgi:hypothetical protein